MTTMKLIHLRLGYYLLLLIPAVVHGLTIPTSNHKILVLGANGFLGQEIVHQLNNLEIPCTTASRTEVDLTSSNAQMRVQELAQGCDAVISTVGSLGTKDDLVVNSSNQAAAKGALAAGVKRFVSIGNDPKVRFLTQQIFKDYAQGKEESERVIKQCFPDTYTIVQPTFIHGGDEFQLNPPRVPSRLGTLAEDLLGLYPFQSASEALPGVFGVAIQAPMSRERVARACVNAALGLVAGDLDCREEILKAASMRPQKGLLLPKPKSSAEELKQKLYDLGDCGGESAKLEQAFELLGKIEDCNARKPAKDPDLNGRWDFVMDVEADIGTGVVKDILNGNSPIKVVFDLKDLYMVIRDNKVVTIHVDTSVLGMPAELKLTTTLIPDENDDTGTGFMEQFQGIELMGRTFPVPKDWQRARPLEFSYLDDNMLIARGNGAEPHYLKR